MTNALRTIWAVLVWIFIIAIPIQFYLAGHGAMEGAHAADKGIGVMKTAWDPHAGFGTLMLLLSLLILLAALAARPPVPLLPMSAALFVFMVIQFILPAAFNDSASTRWVAALHGVNALIVTGLAVSLGIRGRAYLPIGGNRSVPEREAQSA